MTIRSDGRGGNPNTLIERLGFRDEDRRTPEHDEMVAWLDAQLRTETFPRTLIPEIPEPHRTLITWELPIGDSRWIAGFVDVYAEFSGEHSYDNCHLAFEVKSAIPSVGDLIRQIRFYEAKWISEYPYHQAPPFYCLSQHGKHAHTLAAQGIGFVHYPSAQIVAPKRP